MVKEPRYTNNIGLLFCFLLVFLINGFTATVWACRLLESPSPSSDVLWVHLEGLCFSADQREWAVKGSDILEALKDGKSIDIQGALVVGDVLLDELPVQPAAEIPYIPQPVQDHLTQRGIENIRVIPSAITIRDSQFEKNFATNLVNDFLLILGEVDLTGTSFLQAVDFSKIIFAKPFMMANVNVKHEGFFIEAQFEHPVDFSQTNFGTHSRFHKAVFRGPVTFAGVQFQGVAEFLEVEFFQAANFSRANFLSGTGFSGSVFHGPIDFSEVKTKQEIYFRFSEFKDRVSFRDGQFRSVVDFSNSRFDGEYDFSEGEFAVQPDFTASNISVNVQISDGKFNRQSQWMLFGGLVILVGFYLWISRRSMRGHST